MEFVPNNNTNKFKIEDVFLVKTKGISFNNSITNTSKTSKNKPTESYKIYKNPFEVHKYSSEQLKLTQDARYHFNNFIDNNLGLLLCTDKNTSNNCIHFWIFSQFVFQNNISTKNSKEVFFPLFLYPPKSDQLELSSTHTSSFKKGANHPFLEKKANLSTQFIKSISEIIHKKYHQDLSNNEYVSALELFDYIVFNLFYTNLASNEIILPTDKEYFEKCVKKGTTIRELMNWEHKKVFSYISTFPEQGNNLVDKYVYVNSQAIPNRLYINYSEIDENDPNLLQYFENVPQNIWDFKIGKIEPLKIWLDHHVHQKLMFSQIMHFQKMIAIIKEITDLKNHIC